MAADAFNLCLLWMHYYRAASMFLEMACCQISITEHNRSMHFLLASCCRICYIIDRNRESHRSGYPQIISKLFLQTAVTTANSGGYFRFPLKIV